MREEPRGKLPRSSPSAGLSGTGWSESEQTGTQARKPAMRNAVSTPASASSSLSQASCAFRARKSTSLILLR
eukprot:15459527-Alexandrium_andersonii.AAC.1